MELQLFKDKILKAAFDPNVSQKEIEKMIYHFFLQKPIPKIEITHKYLGRCRYNKNGEVFNKVSELSYNPKKNSIASQRCNYPKRQVFYGALPSQTEHASISATAIIETCMEYIKQDDMNLHYMTLSRWQINRPLNIFILPYSKECQ